jgi:hypothetical protein
MIWRFTFGVISVAFVVRYIVAERKLASARERAISRATRDELAPWRAWSAWRNHIIEREHAET